jgi:hypothetical protein
VVVKRVAGLVDVTEIASDSNRPPDSCVAGNPYLTGIMEGLPVTRPG